jgi:hypothetical protein
MLKRIARRVRVYDVSPGAGARETMKHRKTSKKGRQLAGCSRMVARE